MVDRVRETLCEQVGSLLTLTGRGGIGKTRVALAACRLLVDRYPDGIYYLALSCIRDADQLLPAIARASAVRPRRGRSLLAQLADGLIGQRLLVLDGFEQLRAATPTIAALLNSCPGLTVLVTSRWPLEVVGERTIRIPGLHTPDIGTVLSAAESAAFPAIQLFEERARARRPEFRLHAGNAAAVLEICRRLDGVPLAIELAAALVRFLDPTGILARADNWLAILTNETHDGPAHQRSLAASIERSYQLLAPDEQSMLRRIAVFPGEITVAAAASTARVSTEDASKTLAALADKDLVQVATDGRPSFWLAEAVRQYADDRLIAMAEKAESCRSLAGFFGTLAGSAGPRPGMSAQGDLPDSIDQHLPNIRATMRYLLDNEYPQEALQMAVELESFWWVRGDLTEGRNWLGQCLDRQQEDAVLCARAAGIAATLSSRLLDLDGADRFAWAGLRLANALGDPIGAANAREAIGFTAGARGRPDAGQQAFDASIAFWEQVGDRARLARSLEFSATGLLWQGNLPAAAQQIQRSLQLLRDLDDPAQLATSMTTLGLILTYDGKCDDAIAELHGGLTTALALSSPRHIGRAHYGLGLLASRTGRLAEAEDHLVTAIAMVAESRDRSFLPGCVLALATLYEADRPDDAVRLLAAATAQGHDLGLRPPGLLRVEYEQLMHSLRQRLRDARFDAGWSRASRIARDEVLITQIARPHAPQQPTAEVALTKREIEVLTLVARGLSDDQVAGKLVISRRTVHAHLRSIYRKLKLHTRSAATRYAVDHDLR